MAMKKIKSFAIGEGVNDPKRNFGTTKILKKNSHLIVIETPISEKCNDWFVYRFCYDGQKPPSKSLLALSNHE